MIRNQRGQTLAEYALILALLVVIAFGALKIFTGAWKVKFDRTAQMRSGPAGMYP